MFTLSILGIIYASLTTLIILDLKGVIAYSSIGHMGITTLGIFSFNRQGLTGSLFLLLAHGIASPGLFILVTLLYERFHSRIIKYYRGVAITMPIYAIIFLIFTLSNLGLPLLVNFIGEFITLIGVYKSSSIVTFLATTGVIISAAYSLFLYNRVCFGTVSNYIAQDFNNRDITRKEFHLLLPLVVLVILLGVYPEIILSEIKSSISFLSLI
jgi:NADH:ubiquinone oxidoreductase subunit 4 (subunit M)